MRVLLSYVAVGRGGDVIQLLALADGLRARGHEVILVGDGAPAPYAFDTPSARLRKALRALPWWARDLLECSLSCAVALRTLLAARRRRPDLLVHRAGAYDLPMAAVRRCLRTPLVLILDAHLQAERAFRGAGYWRALHARAMCALGHVAVAVITPSRAVADYYARLGLPSGKITVRRNAVSARHLRQGLESVAARPPLADPALCIVGFAGSLSRWHRVDVLLQALHALRRPALGPYAPDRSASGFRLVVVGRGEEEDVLRARADALGLTEAVEWKGALSHDETFAAMSDFDIAVLPDTLPTGAPLKLSEYAALGRPIVAPDRPNIRDLFAVGDEIVLVPPGDAAGLASAIRGLAADPVGARRMGLAAQARMHDVLWEGTADLIVSYAAEGEP